MFIQKKKTPLLVAVLGAISLSLTTSAPAQEPAAQTNAAPAAKPAPKMSDLFADTVVAKGKGVEVKRSQLDDALASIKASAAARGQTLSPTELNQLEGRMLDRLIQIQLLMAKSTDADKAAGKETCAANIEKFKTHLGSEEAFSRQLKASGLTIDGLRSKMTEEATAQAVLEREFKIKVTDGDIQKFYTNNPSKFEQPEMVRASHILISTKDAADTNPNPALRADLSEEQKKAKHKLAEDLLKRARAGEDFAKLAQEYSDDPGSKDKGGEYTFPRGQMMPEFEVAAFALNTNQVSEIVTTQYGYHIIKLSEKMPAKKMELSKVSADIKGYLTQQAMQEVQSQVLDYMAKAKKEAGVEILDEKLKLAEADAAAALPPGHPPIKAEAKPDAK
jgi:peptidyl-prolyl cis-trans isomerase C